MKQCLCNICTDAAVLRCSACKNAFYCSSEHQLLGWYEGHKTKCTTTTTTAAIQQDVGLYLSDTELDRARPIVDEIQRATTDAALRDLVNQLDGIDRPDASLPPVGGEWSTGRIRRILTDPKLTPIFGEAIYLTVLKDRPDLVDEVVRTILVDRLKSKKKASTYLGELGTEYGLFKDGGEAHARYGSLFGAQSMLSLAVQLGSTKTVQHIMDEIATETLDEDGEKSTWLSDNQGFRNHATPGDAIFERALDDLNPRSHEAYLMLVKRGMLFGDRAESRQGGRSRVSQLFVLQKFKFIKLLVVTYNKSGQSAENLNLNTRFSEASSPGAVNMLTFLNSLPFNSDLFSPKSGFEPVHWALDWLVSRGNRIGFLFNGINNTARLSTPLPRFTFYAMIEQLYNTAASFRIVVENASNRTKEDTALKLAIQASAVPLAVEFVRLATQNGINKDLLVREIISTTPLVQEQPLLDPSFFLPLLSAASITTHDLVQVVSNRRDFVGWLSLLTNETINRLNSNTPKDLWRYITTKSDFASEFLTDSAAVERYNDKVEEAEFKLKSV